MKKNKLISAIFLVLAALIWGSAFVAQDKAVEYIGTFTINGIRFVIGSIFLIPVILITRKSRHKKIFENNKKDRKTLIIASLICGTALAIAANVQQFGIAMYPDTAATSGRAGFITALYVIIVPLLGILFFKKKITIPLFIAIILSVIGLYLLCLTNGISNIEKGDYIILICSFCFAIQIMAIDYFIDKVDPIKLSSLQFLICGIISLILMFIFETPKMDSILLVWKEILFLGIFSSGIAYTFQIIGQKYSDNPTVASILMSLESVFAALAGAIFSNETLKSREILGCVIMFLAIILAQIPSDIFKSKKIKEDK